MSLMTNYTKNQMVEVLTRYQGNGHYAPDGGEGIFYVVRDLGDDLKVSREPDGDYDFIVHKSRIKGGSNGAMAQGRASERETPVVERRPVPERVAGLLFETL